MHCVWARSVCAAFLAAWGAEADETKKIGIYVDFERSPSARAVEVMQKATRDLLAGTGFEPVWRQRGKQSGSELFHSIVFVRFKGICRPDLTAWGAPRPDPLAANVRLASARVVSGRVQPWAEVECDRIRKTADAAPFKERATVLGTALARVVTHELYHILLNTTKHSLDGLAKSALTFEELIEPETSLSARDVLNFH